MKRIAGAFLLAAGLSGGCTQADKSPFKSPFDQAARQATSARLMPNGQMARVPTNYTGPHGEPITPAAYRGMPPAMMGMPMGGFTAGESPKPGADLIRAGYLGDTKGGVVQAGGHMPPQPTTPYFNPGKSGILPVPQMGPPGAVAAVGALPYRMPPQLQNQRSSVHFVNPEGMRITWFGASGWNDQPLVSPARYNYLQGGVYRLRLSSIPNRLERVYYPTLEVVPAQEASATYLAHSSVPVSFTDEDFEQVDSGNFLVKVVYLPNPANQDIATVVGPNELVSTRLEPGIDPIVEAQKRGTILLIVRLGNIDLNVPNSPPLDAPNPFMMGPAMMGPAMGAPPTGAPSAMPKVEIKEPKIEPIPQKKIVEPADINQVPSIPTSNGRPTVLPNLQ